MRVDPPARLALGAATGVLFGTLLQKSQASKYTVITNQLRLRDMRLVKLMGTAIAVGAVGVHALAHVGKVQLQIEPLQAGRIVGGATLFGAGLALLGYCPGTSLAAVGEGRRDALAGVAGMLVGAAAFVRAAPRLQPLLEAGDVGKATLPTLTKTSPRSWVIGLAAIVGLAALVSRGR